MVERRSGPNLLKTGSLAATFAGVLGISFAGTKTEKLAAAAVGASEPARPNIILILTDDQGYGDLGRHGNPLLRTPNMDRLFNESARFSNFVVSPTCAPTRCALMTGMHEFKSGITHTIEGRCEMSLSATTLAQHLKSAGYATGIFGKWHLGSKGDYRPEQRGFDVSVTTVNDSQNSHFDPILLFNGSKRQQQGYREDILFAEAFQFIKAHEDQPFFCYIPTYSPHSPNKVPEKYLQQYNGDGFFGQIANIDDNIGKLLDQLKTSGLDSTTLVIFMNDNGGTWGVDLFNAGMRGCKGTGWFGGTRAISFWRWPGHFSPRDIDPLAGAVDLLPTLAELADAPIPDVLKGRLDGVSLLAILRGDAWQLPDRMLISHVGRWRDGEEEAHKHALCSVHWNDYLLVSSQTCGNPGCKGECRVFHQALKDGIREGYSSKKGDFHYAMNTRPGWALYDVRKDPGQLHDIADNNPELVGKMAATYEAWWKEVNPQIHRVSIKEFNPFKDWYTTSVEEAFRNPTGESKSFGFWWWLNNRVDKQGITRDLEEFKDKGLGGVILIITGNWVSPNPPAGARLLSPEWRELFRHALGEASRLGLEVGVNFCGGGWTMGGPWITPRLNVRWLVQSELTLTGPQKFSGKLPEPDPRGGYRPASGQSYTDIGLLGGEQIMNWPAERMDYRDCAIVALREPDLLANKLGKDRMQLLDAKTNRWGAYCFIKASEVMERSLIPWTSIPADQASSPSEIIDLTGKVKPDGSLDWEVPAGNWTIIRSGHIATGSPIMCPLPGMEGALAVDWLNPETVDTMFRHFGDILLKDAGPLAGKTLKYFHVDSFEDGLLNWTDDLLAKFREYRGYDPEPYTPVFSGRMIGNAEISDRFLYDYRKTVADLFADGPFKRLRDKAQQIGMLTQYESGGPSWPGTVCMDALKNLGRADVPMGEFWLQSTFIEENQNKVCKQVSSAAHIYGKKIASAESFTSVRHWQEAPEHIKPVVDRAFCEGINRIVFHQMTSTRPSDGLPGYEYGAGTHFNPNVTWWNQAAGSWISYVNHCSALLQSGLFVADVLFYNGDWAPNLVGPKQVHPSLGKGYDYDVCNAEVLLTRLSVSNGRITLPDGMSYHLLVLPDRNTMPVEVVRKIDELVRGGATVVGPRPESDPGLKDYPVCDEIVRSLAAGLWGNVDGKAVRERRIGQGRIIWGKSLRDILQDDGVPPDFRHDETVDAFIDYIHRTADGTEIYFLANRNARPESIACTFRVAGKQLELWDPVAGTIRELPEFETKENQTVVPLKFEPHGSMFVVFRKETIRPPGKSMSVARNFTGYRTVQNITGPWTVRFDPVWLYPKEGLTGQQAEGEVVFRTLEDWTERPEPAIRHYSGTASYSTVLDLEALPGQPCFLNLGKVKEIATVRLNGITLGTIWCHPWQVDISRALRAGKNALGIDVVNLWPNRLSGDAAMPEKLRQTKTNIDLGIFKPISSGLLGPVTLQVAYPDN